MKNANPVVRGTIIFFTVLILITAIDSVQSAPGDLIGATVQRAAPDRILVRFKPGTPAQAVAAAHGGVNPATEHSYGFLDGLKLFVLPPGTDINSAIDRYRKNPNVSYVEPDYELSSTATNDTSFSSLWGLNNTGQTVNGVTGTSDKDMNIVEAWANSGVTGSNSVVIAVIDSGVQYTHPDLQANMWVNPGEIAGNNQDDDGNGYIDDVYGINAIANNGNPMDDNNHGTHVAGTIAAVGNNSAGITGVVQQAKIIACKFLSSTGSGSSSDSLECLDYIYNLKVNKGINIIATNNSWGGGGYSQSIADAIDKHRQAGILFVAAAGNDAANNDTSPHYPANYYKANVISVAATDQHDGLASFSDYGRLTVHVGAPGVNIYSTIPNNTYTHFQGTSMAAPNVTGLVALLKAQDPNRDWRTLKNLVIASGTPATALNGKSITGRRVRAWDNNGTGAMTCSSQTVAAKIYPQGSSTTLIAGTKVGIAVLNIDCATPNGTMNVTTSGPASVGAVTLQDDGLGFDQAAGDGIYSGYWTAPATSGAYTLTYGTTGQTHSVTVQANTSTRTPYRAPVAITYNPRILSEVTMPFTAIADTTYGGISSCGVNRNYYGGVAISTIWATAKGTMMIEQPVANEKLTGVNTELANSGFETLLAPYWDDLDLTAGGNGVRGWTWGACSPNAEIVYEWKGVTKGTANAVRIQVVLAADSSNVEVHYASVDNNGAGATTGMQVDWVRATTQNYNFANTDIAANKAYRWSLDTGAPTANAGTTQNVNGNTLVNLSGTANDPDGGAMSYSWSQTAGTLVSLSGANTLTPSFYAPNVTGTLTFQLTVTDDANRTATSNVVVGVTQVASAGQLALSATSYSVNESAGNATITVTRTNGSNGPTSVMYAIADGTAAASSDFTFTSGTLSWIDGETTSKTFNVPILDDTTGESSETFSVLLSNATGGAVITSTNATVTILDNDGPGTISLDASTYSVQENGSTLTVTLTRSNGSNGTVAVSYATADGSALSASDYTATSGTITFATGETTKSLLLNITDDSNVESSESFTLVLSNPTGESSLGTSSTTITITDNDTAPVAVNQPPVKPVLIAPFDGDSKVNGSLVTFEWEPVTDPDGDTVSYELLYCTDITFAGCNPTLVAKARNDSSDMLVAGLGGSFGLAMLGMMGYLSRRQRIINAVLVVALAYFTTACGFNIVPAPTGKFYDVTGLQSKTTYYWKVVATDGKGGRTESDTWSFTTL